MQSCESYENINDRLSEVKQHQRTLRKDIDKYNEEKSFYDNIHECPQCKQSIGSDHREHIIGTVDQNIQKLHEELVGIEDTLETLGEEYAKWQKCLSVIAELNSSMSALNKEIHGYSVEIKSKKKLLDSTDTTSLEEETVKLKAFAKDIVVRDKQKKEMLDVTAYQNVIYGLLQDSGIKSRVIKQYIPIINKLVNKYLESLDFFVNFTLDENFNEVIKSRHRDTFTYDSFSEGQKMRTDLALIFAWRELARLKNSVNTNLVFFDEILDGSLDENGISLVFQLLRSMKNTNVFVISHREAIADKFDNSLEFELRNGFSQLV
jgi:DNA repair exonuclease SbcCD ATPase subunit